MLLERPKVLLGPACNRLVLLVLLQGAPGHHCSTLRAPTAAETALTEIARAATNARLSLLAFEVLRLLLEMNWQGSGARHGAHNSGVLCGPNGAGPTDLSPLQTQLRQSNRADVCQSSASQQYACTLLSFPLHAKQPPAAVAAGAEGKRRDS